MTGKVSEPATGETRVSLSEQYRIAVELGFDHSRPLEQRRDALLHAIELRRMHGEPAAMAAGWPGEPCEESGILLVQVQRLERKIRLGLED